MHQNFLHDVNTNSFLGNFNSKRKREIKILFIYVSLSSFIRRDLETLEKHFIFQKMRIVTFLVPRKGRDPCVFFRLLKGVLWSDVVFSWWANLNAFFLALICMFLRKKYVIVVGGSDVVYIPEIDYGALQSSWMHIRTKFILEHATKVIPFSEYAKDRVLSITKNTNVCMLILGCDLEKFKPALEKKENLVVSVCHITKKNIARKGLSTFIESAKLLPNIQFVLIGYLWDDSARHLKETAPPNVKFTGYVSDEELVSWYQRAKVYCQLSYEEGEGVGGALGEAMACACVPVVSEKAVALKDAVGCSGFYVPYGDAEATVKAIELAMKTSPELGTKVRKRMEKLFPLDKRTHTLIKLIETLVI